MNEPEFPGWTSTRAGLELHQGLYALGLEAVGAGAVARQLLPGIPGSVLHGRYFSFLCWAFWTHHQYLLAHTAREITRADQRRWLHRLEHVLRAATLATDPDVMGLAGRRSAKSIAGLPDSQTIPVTTDVTVPSAFVPAAYSASFAMLGCGQERGGIVFLTEIGQALARAYDQTIRATPDSLTALRQVLSEEELVGVGAIRTLQAGLAIRPLQPEEPEHALLVDLLFRTHAVRDGVWGIQDASRSRCLALLLHIIESTPGTLTSPTDLHAVFATARLPNGTPYDPPASLEQSFGLWERYEERQGEKLGLHGFWHEVTRFLSSRDVASAPSGAIVAHISNLVAASTLSAQWLGPSPLTVTVAEAELLVLRRATDGDRPKGQASLELIEIVMHSSSVEDAAAASLLLLLLATASWRETRGTLPESLVRFHKQGNRERIALNVLTRDAEERSMQTVAEYLSWLLECCVLSQSTAVALEKLARGDYRFFIIRDEDGFRVVRPQDPRAYLTRDASRLNAAISLLSDLRLVDRSHGYRLTTAGRTTLQRVLEFHGQSLRS